MSVGEIIAAAGDCELKRVLCASGFHLLLMHRRLSFRSNIKANTHGEGLSALFREDCLLYFFLTDERAGDVGLELLIPHTHSCCQSGKKGCPSSSKKKRILSGDCIHGHLSFLSPEDPVRDHLLHRRARRQAGEEATDSRGSPAHHHQEEEESRAQEFGLQLQSHTRIQETRGWGTRLTARSAS